MIAKECNKSATAGAEDEVIIFNLSDLDRENSVVSTDNVITALELKAGKKAYTFTTFGKSLGESGATFTLGTYRNTWIHTIMQRIFTKNEEAKKYVNSLGLGAKICAIVKNNERGENGEVKYELYGWDNGLILKESASTIAMTDGVVYPLTVGSEETAQESTLPKSIFVTDLATTEQMINSLTAV